MVSGFQGTPLSSGAPPRSLLEIVRGEFRFLMLAAALGLALALVYTNVAERRYAVTLTLVPTEQSDNALKSLSGGSLGSLASLAGVNLPGSSNSLNFDLMPDAIVSRETATQLSLDQDLMHATFDRDWDPVGKSWREPHGLLRTIRKAITTPLAFVVGNEVEPYSPPGPQEMQSFLEKRLMVSRDRKRPVITVSMLHRDPEYAKALIYRTWKVADDRMKQSSLERSTANIDYLSKRLIETQTLDYRLYLYTVMSQEEKRRMTTSNSLPFVAEPFGVPTASAKPVSPNIPLALATGLAGGAIFGFAVMMVRRRKEIAPALKALLREE